MAKTKYFVKKGSKMSDFPCIFGQNLELMALNKESLVPPPLEDDCDLVSFNIVQSVLMFVYFREPDNIHESLALYKLQTTPGSTISLSTDMQTNTMQTNTIHTVESVTVMAGVERTIV